jgi:hypothetical protein
MHPSARRLLCPVLMTVLGLGCLRIAGAQPAESVEIRPPFGLSWGESSARLDGLLTTAKARVVERRLIGARECWTVEGLVQPNLKRTLFYFSGGALSEIELQYQSPDWDSSRYESFMSQVRGRIEQRYGPGKLIARTKAPEKEVMQTVIGYQWTQPGP